MTNVIFDMEVGLYIIVKLQTHPLEPLKEKVESLLLR